MVPGGGFRLYQTSAASWDSRKLYRCRHTHGVARVPLEATCQAIKESYGGLLHRVHLAQFGGARTARLPLLFSHKHHPPQLLEVSGSTAKSAEDPLQLALSTRFAARAALLA